MPLTHVLKYFPKQMSLNEMKMNSRVKLIFRRTVVFFNLTFVLKQKQRGNTKISGFHLSFLDPFIPQGLVEATSNSDE